MSITLLALAAAATASPDTVVGRWRTETRNGIVEITRCGSSLCGNLVTSDGIAASPALKDTNNKDEKLRNRTLKGLPMLWGFRFDAGTWAKGNVYNAEDGGTYSATITTADANTLKLKGCIVWPLCKNQVWHRVH